MDPNFIHRADVLDHFAAAGAVPDANAICYLVGGGIALTVWALGATFFGRSSRGNFGRTHQLVADETLAADEHALLQPESGVRLKATPPEESTPAYETAV